MTKSITIRNLLRALLAGWGAKKLGFGCFGAIIAAIIIYCLPEYMF